MNEYTFQDHVGNELQFEGDLILERNGAIEVDKEFERAVSVRVYGIESGGFVSILEYESNSPKETHVKVFEVVDLLKDVECFFFVFEATDVFKEDRIQDRDDVEEQKKVCRAISKRIENLVFELLDDLQSVAQSKGFIDKPAEVKKKSMWGLLG